MTNLMLNTVHSLSKGRIVLMVVANWWFRHYPAQAFIRTGLLVD